MNPRPPAPHVDRSTETMEDTPAMLAQAAAIFLTPIIFAALAAGLTRLLWHRALARVSWWSLAWPAMTTASGVAVAGLLWAGRDGRMLTYGVMVAVCALTLWWRGFGPRRR
jgi:hypothetical protein